MAAAEQSLAERLVSGDKRALARAISLVENDDPEGWALVREVYPRTGGASVVGFTGPPGGGKSTLMGALTKLERAREQTVGVLSIDPSSPFTHGALLGDRIRLSEHFLDPGVFIRSMAKTEAVRGEGVDELADKLAEHRAYIESEGTLTERRRRNLMNEVLAIATFRMRRELEASVREDPDVKELLDRVVSRELDPASAATTILERPLARQ